jgi:hypothetical protein
MRKPFTSEWQEAWKKWPGIGVMECVIARNYGRMIIHPGSGDFRYCSYCKPNNWQGKLADFMDTPGDTYTKVVEGPKAEGEVWFPR